MLLIQGFSTRIKLKYRKAARTYVRAALLSNIFLESTGSTTYTLMILIHSNGENQNKELGKAISGKINVHAKQVRY